MSTENNILVKLNGVGLKQNEKWLVKGVSLKVEKGKIQVIVEIFGRATPIDLDFNQVEKI